MHFRPLLSEDFRHAQMLTDQEWMDQHGEFIREFMYSLASHDLPIQTRFHGVFDEGRLVALGCVADSTANYIMATLSWIIVDRRVRGAGYGRMLVERLEDVARIDMGKTDMLFTTAIPEFYEHLGYQRLVRVGSGNTMMHKSLG